MTEQVTWHRYTGGGTDEWGDPSGSTFEDVLLHEQDGQSVSFAPESTEEPRDGSSQRVVSEAKLYLDIPIDYTSRDQFSARGVRFDVEGEGLGGWENPYTGWGAGQEIMLRRTHG